MVNYLITQNIDSLHREGTNINEFQRRNFKIDRNNDRPKTK